MTAACIFQYGLIPSFVGRSLNCNSLLPPRDRVSGVDTLEPPNRPTIET